MRGRSSAWWSVATQYVTSKVASAKGRCSPSAWTRREVAVERAAAEPDLRIDEDVGRDVLAVALEPEARGPRLRRADLEHAQAARVADVAAEQHLERVAVRAASSSRPSRARDSRTGARRRPRRRARTSPRPAPSRPSPRPRRSFSGAPGRSSWSMSGIPSGERPKRRPQPGQASRRLRRRGSSRRKGSAGARGAAFPSVCGPTYRARVRWPPCPNTPLTAVRYADAPCYEPLDRRGGGGLRRDGRGGRARRAAGQPADDLGAPAGRPCARFVVAAPRADRWHKRSTPLLGGIGIIAGLLAAVGDRPRRGPHSGEPRARRHPRRLRHPLRRRADRRPLRPPAAREARARRAPRRRSCSLAGIRVQIVHNDVARDAHRRRLADRR